jgi:hypothetical protein
MSITFSKKLTAAALISAAVAGSICVSVAVAQVGPKQASDAASPAAQSYSPPVMREHGNELLTYFGRLKSSGKWCSCDLKTWKQLVKRDAVVGDEFGWARYDAHGLVSVTFAQQSEDAFAEDRYFIGSDGRASKMIRTGAYSNDPVASVIFEPDPQGRLRLSASGKDVVRKMTAAGFETYFVDWNHFSKLSQIPFAPLLSLKARGAGSGC